MDGKRAVATMTLKMDRHYKEYHRVVLSLSEALDKTGGLLLTVDIFFASVVSFFSLRVFQLDFVKENYTVLEGKSSDVVPD